MSTNDEAQEYQESITVKFEWTLKDLKNIFESSKGEAKSKATKSAKFGGGRWQILFYANSGTSSGASTDGGYVSLFLSCEPTQEERENSTNGRWTREGRFRFSFELRNLGKVVLFNAKEAHDHSFSWKTANWGWAQFSRRDTVYYLSNAVRAQDAFVIICNITSSPAPPSPQPPSDRRSVPKVLLESVGGLLNDPLYSDVEFVLPRRGRRKEFKTIYAAKRILRRADYFDMMFGSGFAEASSEQPTIALTQADQCTSQLDDNTSDADLSARDPEDSDDEDSDAPDSDVELDSHDMALPENESGGGGANAGPALNNDHSEDVPIVHSLVPGEVTTASEDWQDLESNTMSRGEDDSDRNVRPKLSHPSSPRSSELSLERKTERGRSTSTESVPGPSKLRVVVRDVAYHTYLSVLYYIYTDCIIFAPLSSTFLSSSAQAPTVPVSNPLSSTGQSVSDNSNSAASGVRSTAPSDLHVRSTTRKEWIRHWERKHPGQPTPCSAKAVYRLADKLDLRELKERAFQHIVKSLTVQNVPYEMFSSFSGTFEDVRKVEMQFFLEHWGEIRTSDAMRNIWPQIRAGRHPGFEEVWPLVVSSLEYKPPAADSSESNSSGP